PESGDRGVAPSRAPGRRRRRPRRPGGERGGARSARRRRRLPGHALAVSRGRRVLRRLRSDDRRGSARRSGARRQPRSRHRRHYSIHFAAMKPILDVARAIDLAPEDLELYGPYKAKLRRAALAGKPARGALVLVSAITPTPAGEGKTTTSIGLAQGL